MDVAVSRLRAELALWIKLAQDGEEISITDRGLPVAKLVPVDSAPLLDRLTREGILGRPLSADRPLAREIARVPSKGSVSDLVAEQRR
jgi:prevent-host-death family protein